MPGLRVQQVRVSNSGKQQRAELRVALQRKGRHALLYSASISGFDLYCSAHSGTTHHRLESSYHESGKTHTKVGHDAYRLDDGWERDLASFKGYRRLYSGSAAPDGLTWTYKPKKDSASRKTLVLDLDHVDLWIVDLWMIEKHRLDLVLRVLDRGCDFEIVDHARIDWTQPWLYAVAWRPTDELVSGLRDSLPPGMKLSALATGGPPVGPIRSFKLPYAREDN